jgi:alpha-glucosidase
MAASSPSPWWRDAVVYQIYPRSFQDSDGDGVGDLAGIASRLDHLEWLGVDALWLSPIYPSPGADLGYDVSDHTAVDPLFGTLADLDALIADCHRRGIRFVVDLVASHTSIEHPWFREHPDWYVWADGDRPPNNWLASFGGPAWTRDERSGRWYLHSFYPEQPDLDWRNPEVREAIAGVVRFWRERGVDGFRLDAIERAMKDRELRDDPPAAGEPVLPVPTELARIEQIRSRNDPEIGLVLGALREAAGDALLIGEVYLPTAGLAPYLEHLDLAFGFELLHSSWDADRLRAVIAEASELGGVAWVLSNHDFPRLATRLGERAARGAAILLLTLPGTAFVYQGDEIGMVDGGQGRPPVDRFGRDAHRNPMQWDRSPGGGFTEGEPWLAPTDPASRNVADQRRDPGSVLSLYRRLIALRRELDGELRIVDSQPGIVAFVRGGHLIAVNAGERPARAPEYGEVVLASDASPGPEIAPGEGLIARLEV